MPYYGEINQAGEHRARALVFDLSTNSREVPRCGFADVVLAVGEMLADPGEFVVLSPREPIRGAQFLQAARYPRGVVVEVSLQQGEGQQMLRRLIPYGQEGGVKDLFVDFLQWGRLPPLEGFYPVEPGDDYAECCEEGENGKSR